MVWPRRTPSAFASGSVSNPGSRRQSAVARDQTATQPTEEQQPFVRNETTGGFMEVNNGPTPRLPPDHEFFEANFKFRIPDHESLPQVSERALEPLEDAHTTPPSNRPAALAAAAAMASANPSHINTTPPDPPTYPDVPDAMVNIKTPNYPSYAYPQLDFDPASEQAEVSASFAGRDVTWDSLYPPARPSIPTPRTITTTTTASSVRKPWSSYTQLNEPSSFVKHYNETHKQSSNEDGKRILGVKRKVFWLVLAIILSFIVAGAVGGAVYAAVGAAQDDKANSISSSDGGVGGGGDNAGDNAGTGNGSESGESGDSESSSSPGSNVKGISGELGILPDTRLSAVNFTGSGGDANYIVFYQLRNGRIAQSYWSGRDETWETSYVTSSALKMGTAIGASVFWHQAESRDVRIYCSNTDNEVVGYIKGGGGVGAAPSDWSPSGVSGQFKAHASSYLLSNGKETPDAFLENMVMYQDSDDIIRILSRRSDPEKWDSAAVSIQNGVPVNASGLAVVPIYSKTDPSLKLFYNERNGGALKSVTIGGGDSGDEEILPSKVDDDVNIAAWSAGYDHNEDGYEIQVLSLKPGESVQRMTRKPDNTWENADEVEELSGDEVPQAIAANQAARVYGTVDDGDGNVAIVEWSWKDGKFERIGVVDTTIENRQT